MTIPSRSAAARLLLSLEPPAWFLSHACAVADVAAWLARASAVNGHGVNRSLVEAAALLHDIDKLPAARRAIGTGPAPLRHGDGSAAWLERLGMEELAEVVRDHPVTRLAEATHPAWLRNASPEARIVAYADKRAGQRLEPVEARFASWGRRYPDGWDGATAALVEGRARELERDVCAAAGVDPRAVRRLRWSRRALREAAA